MNDQWQRLIDQHLNAWLSDPSLVADVGMDSPSMAIIEQSTKIAKRLRNDGFIAPDRVIPDPNGGIIFERQEGNVTETVHIWDDGSVEYMRFIGTKLVQRTPDCDVFRQAGNA